MRKFIIFLIFAGVVFQYYNRDQQLDLTPKVNLNQWAQKLSQRANTKASEASLKCPADHYVQVAADLSEASCIKRTQL